MLKDYLIYNDDIHEYSIQYNPAQKIIIPSVSQLMEYCRVVENGFIDPHYAETGTQIHSMTEVVDLGLYDESLTDGRAHAALIAYEQFLLEHDVTWEETERIVFNENLFFAGTRDRLGLVDGIPTIVDIKSGSKYRWHALQLAGYLLCEPRRYQVADLYLGAGAYTYHVWDEEDLREPLDIFAKMAHVYWYNHPMDYKRLEKIKKELAA